VLEFENKRRFFSNKVIKSLILDYILCVLFRDSLHTVGCMVDRHSEIDDKEKMINE